jgi:lysylphosphatidylglycerol synthetase-like protein (DUF2156 family)
LGVQVSPDGKWWWNGQAWLPMAADPAPTPARLPGALVAAVVINLAGAALVLMLGLLLLIVSRTPEFTQRLQADTSVDIDPATLALILTVGILGYGLYLVAVNALLGWFMVKRAAWAWITTVVLLGLGLLLQLFSAIGSPQALIWIALFQIPPAVLLVVAPSRRWCHIGRDPAASAFQYSAYPWYGGYPPPPATSPHPPTPPQY